MGIMFLSYKNTCMATQANEFCRTNLFRKYQDKMYKWNLYELPIWIWYTYVDLFMEKIMTKYDSDHIILNRFRCNSYYLDLDGKVKYIPDGFRMAIQPNPKYNQNAYDLEKYFIEKYNPWVIDLSKYFMGDRNCWDNLNGAHFEKEFYRETFDQIKRIIFEKDAKRYYDEPDFFNKDRRGWSEDIERKFDVDAALCSDGVFYNLLNSGDILWLNILDKMNMYAPDNKRVIELVEWMNENKISTGINIDEDTKRYYPYSTVASQVIGFCGSDNQGLSGIESKWESVLTGTPGKIVSSKASNQQEIPNAEETYISAENGSDLTLTIDLNIQTIVEKYLKQAVDDNNCKKGGNVIVMNPKNGDILAMATYPNYDLNSPYTPNSAIAETYNSLSDSEKSTTLYKMWSNKSVAETYEPGSVFKVITSSVALEENITTTDKAGDFVCKGYEEFEDASSSTPLRIACWRAQPHGVQTLRQALMNSCNPAFMQLGKRIGIQTLYKYYEAFGLFDSTNSGLYGEQSSIFQNIDKVGPVELATMSFGQRLNVTPLQMITAISCVANDGKLMKPRIVKEITNTDTGSVTEVQPTEVRQVISKQTSQEVKSMMESVVTQGTGRHAAVAGYSIGGKTGTSEPTYNKLDEGYVASYVAISPVEDTQVVLLLTLYDPPKNNHQGGQLAGPVVSQMLSEILPYLGIPSTEDSSSSDSSSNITVPDVRNKTVAEAEKTLKNAGFTVKTYVKGDANNTLVADQTPKPGSSLAKNSIIVIYGEGSDVATSVTVPDLKGMNASQATSVLRNKNLNISIEGSRSSYYTRFG